MVGAAVRDLRIANQLAERGYPVHVYWAMECTPVIPLHPRIKEHWLFCASRYNGILKNLFRSKYSIVEDIVWSRICRLAPVKFKMRLCQRGVFGINVAAWAMNGVIRHICRGVESDRGQLKRFARSLDRERITHVMPCLSLFGPFVQGAKPYLRDPIRYLVTYQGYEIYANYAKQIGCLEQFYQRIRETAEQSDYPAVAVSEDYKSRVNEDLGLALDRITIVPACIDLPESRDVEQSRKVLQQSFPDYDPALPLISFLGRQDSEKGIDLLLYAAKMLHQRGYRFQVAIAGATACGTKYRDACRTIAENLRIPVITADYLSSELRASLYQASHCVVYPSIHREPFGMVPIEAMAMGTPVVVPDTGGVAELPYLNGLQAGLNFKSWDSGDLAQQLARMLDDRAMHVAFRADAIAIAEHYSTPRVCDQLLQLLDVSPAVEVEAPSRIKSMVAASL